MRVLLDECVPDRLKRFLSPHAVTTVSRIGWSGIKNGQLLALAGAEFDVLLTVDRNMASQQQLTKFKIGVLLVCARSNRLEDIRPLVPKILQALEQTASGSLTLVSV